MEVHIIHPQRESGYVEMEAKGQSGGREEFLASRQGSIKPQLAREPDSGSAWMCVAASLQHDYDGGTPEGCGDDCI